jgi:hypothetical protein
MKEEYRAPHRHLKRWQAKRFCLVESIRGKAFPALRNAAKPGFS